MALKIINVNQNKHNVYKDIFDLIFAMIFQM